MASSGTSRQLTRKGYLALGLILVHLAISMLHGGAHQHLLIGLSESQQFFVWTVILAAPLVAALLLLVKLPRAGGLLLSFSMAGSLVFGLWNHFLIPGADNVGSTPSAGWGLTFQATAALLLLTEALGCAAGITLLR